MLHRALCKYSCITTEITLKMISDLKMSGIMESHN